MLLCNIPCVDSQACVCLFCCQWALGCFQLVPHAETCQEHSLIHVGAQRCAFNVVCTYSVVLFSQERSYLFTLLLAVVLSSLFSMSAPTTGVVSLFQVSHSSGCMVLSHSDLNLPFPGD